MQVATPHPHTAVRLLMNYMYIVPIILLYTIIAGLWCMYRYYNSLLVSIQVLEPVIMELEHLDLDLDLDSGQVYIYILLAI